MCLTKHAVGQSARYAHTLPLTPDVMPRKNMNEIEFIGNIDACFPYDDENEWRKLIHQGFKISDNASFMVLHEIYGAPEEVPKSDLFSMLEEWQKTNTHPLKDELAKVVRRTIKGDVLGCDQVIELMERASIYKDLYNALGILSFACPDEDGRVDVVYKRIINQWRKA